MADLKKYRDDERQEVKDYATGISSALNKGDKQVATTLRHIQSEERGHEKELNSLIKRDDMAEEKKKKKHAGHGYTATHIEHHADGSHTVHHVHEDGPHKDVRSAVADHDGLMDHIMDHTSQPNPGEAEAQAGPVPAAAPAGPVPAAAPAGPVPGGPAGPMGA